VKGEEYVTMAAPTHQATGTVVASTGPVTVVWPAHVTDDIALLFVESANEAVSLTTAAGFVAVTNQGTGTAGVAGATRLSVFWCRATSSAQASPVVADSGTRQTAFIMTFRGCIKTGNPWDVFAGNVAAAATTAVSIPTATTTVIETLVVNAMSNPLAPAAPTVQPASLINSTLATLTKRKNTQSDGVGGGTATSGFLPVGFFSFGSGGISGDVGEGPDLVSADPRCTACMYVPNISTIAAQIDRADQFNILLILNVAGNKQSYTTTVNGVPTLDMAKYEANMLKFRPDADNTAFPDRLILADAVRRRRVVFYGVDEPNLNTGTVSNVPNISPTQANQMGLLHKTTWAGYNPITCIRVPAETMASGWNGSPKPPGGWTGYDYCWSQYTIRHGRGDSVNQPWTTPLNPQAVLDEQKQIIATNNLNMGVFVSLNMWAGGIGIDAPWGVTAKWDTDGAGGSSVLGWVGGTRDANEAQVITGATLDTAQKSVAANPDMVAKFAQITALDPDVPVCLFWQHVNVGAAAEEFLSYYERADYRAAFDAAINFGKARTTFTGWRTAK
jgi:hypothetical protein